MDTRRGGRRLRVVTCGHLIRPVGIVSEEPTRIALDLQTLGVGARRTPLLHNLLLHRTLTLYAYLSSPPTLPPSKQTHTQTTMLKLLTLAACVAVAFAGLRASDPAGLGRKQEIEPNDPRDKDFKGTHVTGDFCLQMLKDVQDKKAPYYAEGAYTKECRTKLKSGCHERICGWKKAYECAKNEPCPCDKIEDIAKIPVKTITVSSNACGCATCPCPSTVKVVQIEKVRETREGREETSEGRVWKRILGGGWEGERGGERKTRQDDLPVLSPVFGPSGGAWCVHSV